MGEKISKPASTAEANSTATIEGGPGGHSHGPCRVQNYLLVWLDANVTTSDEDSQHTLHELQSVVNEVNLFIEPEECITFLEGVKLEKVFLIVSGSLGRDFVPRIDRMTQIDTIYIFCGDKSRHEEWVKKWPKVKGIYTQIKSICEALELAVQQCNRDYTAMSFAQISREVATDINLNQLEPSFMYTQLFKETLLDMEHDRKKEVRDLVKYCKETHVGNSDQLKLIEEFSHNYQPDQAIWWYTREGFTYQMLNRALRLLEADIIVNMGFFIHDLHQQIQQLHKEQVGGHSGKSFIVYRGQGLSIADLEKVRKTQGGLMSFNCFVSTSTKQEESLKFARTAAMDQDRVGILFVMTIDPNISSSPFADIQSSSYFKKEAEILFSMHTVFRIGTIGSMDERKRLVEVNLTFTADDDMQLRALTDQLGDKIRTLHGWDRMGHLLIDVGQPNKAEELYHTLLEQSSDPEDQGRYFHQLGYIKNLQGDYQEALSLYERALEIEQKNLPDNHPHLANTYNNIGLVYDNLGEFSKALSSHERALEIRQKRLPVNHPDLATSYNNIGSVYKHMGDFSKALSFYEKDLEINKKSLPANHPDLATSYNNIGVVCEHMGQFSKALSSHELALKIKQKSLPADHFELAASYNNIGLVHKHMGEFSKALSSHERTLEILEKSLPANHPHLATTYNNIGSMYDHMGEFSKALSFYERALEISKKILPGNHADLATPFNNIGVVYQHMGEFSKALSFYERTLEILEKSLPANHPHLAASYNNIGLVSHSMGEFSKALLFYERALEIFKTSLSADHPHVKNVLESIEMLKMKINKE